jgi:hypothetical protein
MQGLRPLVLCLVLGSTGAIAQTNSSSSGDPFRSLKIDVSLTVTKHNTGADLVEITVESPDYPAKELQEQAEAIGNILGAPARGLHIYSENSGAPNGSAFLKATFATNGILAGDAGIRLQAIARAFAGSQNPVPVQGILIGLPETKPLPTTLPSFDSASVAVQGRTAPNPGIEYRVLLKTQDADKIFIPDRLNQQATIKADSSGSKGQPVILVWILTIVGAAATGALVYNLALRGSRRTPHR